MKIRSVFLFYLLVILLSSWILSSCQEKSTDIFDTAPYKYPYKYTEKGIGVHNGDVIPNEECAMAVASSIFNHMEKSANTQNYIPQIVLFDEEDDVWIVSFWEDSTSMMLGGDCSIALQKKDGKVLSIWYGE